MVHEAVGHARLVRHVRHPAVVEPLVGEDAHRGIEDEPALVHLRPRGGGHQAPRLSRAAIGVRHAVGEAGELLAHLVLPVEVQLGGHEALLVGRRGQYLAPGSTIIDPPKLTLSGGCGPTWSAATTKAWFSIARARISTSQCARPGDLGEGGGEQQHARALHGEHAVQLREAEVVADGQPERDAVGALRAHDLGPPSWDSDSR